MAKAKKPVEEQPVAEQPKPWSITQADIDATTDVDVAFTTTRCLPPEDIIPIEYWGHYKGVSGNVYHWMADALFIGGPMPAGDVTFNAGFKEEGEPLMKFLMAHMRSFAPRHEHKIAGIAFMIAQIVTVTPEN